MQNVICRQNSKRQYGQFFTRGWTVACKTYQWQSTMSREHQQTDQSSVYKWMLNTNHCMFRKNKYIMFIHYVYKLLSLFRWNDLKCFFEFLIANRILCVKDAEIHITSILVSLNSVDSVGHKTYINSCRRFLKKNDILYCALFRHM